MPLFFTLFSVVRLHLHSFPTRRSSDLALPLDQQNIESRGMVRRGRFGLEQSVAPPPYGCFRNDPKQVLVHSLDLKLNGLGSTAQKLDRGFALPTLKLAFVEEAHAGQT